MADKVLTTICAVGGIFLSYFAISGWLEHQHHRLYGQAHTQAMYQFGDRQVPMMVEERDSWYKSMGVPEGKMPTSRQLNRFLNDVVEKQ